MDFNALKKSSIDKFNIEVVEDENSFQKLRIQPSELVALLNFTKNNALFAFDRLSTIIAVDLNDQFELLYDLFSTRTGNQGKISVLLNRENPKISSVVDVYKSAYFDECEIFDMFGIVFENNPDLKRLFMPKGWIGHPLRKDYVQNDERLSWNEVKNG